ncbi:neuroblastoma breakpoint family member 6-like protein isoform X2 [Pongo abelii]|uniref:Uncharacterized protein n=1 Tax=Pongo abelii TaxID=9601 RepID=A0A8I5UEN3_PONAB|nr:neuroblastoma breakpoint family member 6-like protein isoform X2 [Pongo abelii]
MQTSIADMEKTLCDTWIKILFPLSTLQTASNCRLMSRIRAMRHMAKRRTRPSGTDCHSQQKARPECEECKDLIESVLEEELQFQERELAKLPRPAARLRIHDPLIQAQAEELTHL